MIVSFDEIIVHNDEFTRDTISIKTSGIYEKSAKVRRKSLLLRFFSLLFEGRTLFALTKIIGKMTKRENRHCKDLKKLLILVSVFDIIILPINGVVLLLPGAAAPKTERTKHMKNTTLRLLSLLLALLMMLSVFCACADDTEEQPDDPDVPVEGDGEGEGDEGDGEEEGEIVYKANIPEGYTAGGEFTVYAYPEDIFVWKDFDWQNAGEITSDRINDAVFKRTSQVEEELDVTIGWFCGQSYADPAELKTAISTGEKAFDIANVTMLNHISMVQQGLLQEINGYGNIDLEAPWWDPNILNDLALMDMNFCLTGDIGTMYKRCIAVIIFNKEMMSDEGLESPYDLVTSNAWTVEEMVMMASDVSEDLDANDMYDDQDKYGMVYFSDVLCAMEIGCGVPYAQVVDGVPELTLNCVEAIDVLEAAAELLYDQELSYSWSANGQNEETAWNMFMSNQALFYYGELHSAEDMRASEYNFGILPMPLYDEYQDGYHHTVNPNVAAVLVIPLTNEDAERTSYIIDSLGAASKNILTPAYYDINLKGVVSRDDESQVSLDIIIATLRYDMGYLYIGETGAMLRDLCNQRSDAFASAWASKESSMQTTIDDIVEAVMSKND